MKVARRENTYLIYTIIITKIMSNKYEIIIYKLKNKMKF